jgi:DNA adenine methylase
MAHKDPPPRPFLKWAGGKRQLLPALHEAVTAAGPFRDYHEPFLGAGALFFSLARAGHLTGERRLSDVNAPLIDTYLGIRDQLPAVIRLLEGHQRRHGETYYYQVRARAPRNAARAARTIYLNRTCYNGLYRENRKGQFNTAFGRYENPRICDAGNLTAVSAALQGATLAACDFECVLDAARAGDRVYFDPPYVPLSKTASFTAYSRDGFDAAAQGRLARAFAKLADRGVKCILSNSMTDVTLRLYRDFWICEVSATRPVNSRADRRGRVPEALITNFPPPASAHRAGR